MSIVVYHRSGFNCDNCGCEFFLSLQNFERSHTLYSMHRHIRACYNTIIKYIRNVKR